MLAIRKGGHRNLEHYYNVIDLDFDKKELLPRLGLHRAISKGDAELLIVYDEESKLEVAYAVTLCRGLHLNGTIIHLTNTNTTNIFIVVNGTNQGL